MPPQQRKAQVGPKRVKSSRSGPTQTPELLFMDEVCAELRLSLATVKRLIKSKELGSMKIAGQRRVSRFDLNRYFRAMRRAEHAAPPASSPAEPAEPSPLERNAREIASAASALLLMCEGGQLVVSRPDGRYAQVPIVAPAQGMPILAADVARIFYIGLEQLGHIAPGGQAPPSDPRQRPLEFEPDVELEEEEEAPPLLESDAEDMLREEEDDRSPEQIAADREGDPQYESSESRADVFDPYPDRL